MDLCETDLNKYMA
jgi:serine/threonine protein kinase